MFPCSNVSAWTPPQSPPPQDNVPQPLNTGPSPQAKIGRFTVGQSVYIPVVFGAHAPSGVDFVFTDSGYVGIGTRTPTTNLYVNGNVQSSVYYDREDDSYYLDLSGGVMPYSLLLNKGVGIGTTSPDGKLEIRQTGTADIFNLYDNTINVLTVLDGGNVGIGISAPTGLLDVNNKFVVTDEQITMNVPLNLAAAGDISIASDLQFTNPTASFIKSYGPLYLQSGDSNHSYDLTLRAFNSGEVVSDAPLNLSNNRITNLATPIDDTDAATKGYVDDIEYWQVTGSYFYPTSMDYTVGIGTTTPSVDLEIYDSGNASELLLSSDADKKSMIYFEDGQTGIYEPANSEDLRFWTGSADQMTITSDGKVGIGTTTPGAKLYVSSDSASENPLAKFQNTNSDGFARVLIDRASAGDYALLGYSTNNAINWYTGTPYQGGGQYVIGNGISLSNAKFTIDSSGNVGIGTTSPSDKLTVVMKSTTNGDGISIKAVNTGGVGSQPSLAYLNPAGSTRWAAGIDVTGDIYRIIDASQTARLVIKQDGSVGIGTTSPAGKLEVYNGNLYVRGGNLNLRDSTGASSSATLNFVSGSGYLSVDKPLYVSSANDNYFAGDVGIGVTDPIAKLDVRGNQYLYNESGETILSIRAGINNTDSVIHFIEDSATKRWTLRSAESDAGKFKINYANETSNAVTIDTSGNVGIGTTVPGSELHINDGLVSVRNTTDGSYKTPTEDYYLAPVGYVDDLFEGDPGVPGAYWTKTATGDHIYKNNTGNVGIGTVIPNYPLDVVGTVKIGNIVFGTGSATGYYNINTYGSGPVFRFFDTANSYTTLGVSGISIGSSYGATAPPTNGAIIQGNVGIGKTDPQYKLDLAGSDVSLLFDNESGYTGPPKSSILSRYKYNSGGSLTGYNTVIAFGKNNAIENNTGGFLALYNKPAGAVAEEAMRIDPDGNVGIATTAPQYKLDVRGAIAAGTAASTNRIHFVATPTSDTDATPKTYVDDLFTGGEGDPGAYWTKTATGDHIYSNNTGNVGIGTASPNTHKLEVIGRGYFSTGASLGTTSTAGTGLTVAGSSVFLGFTEIQNGASAYFYSSGNTYSSVIQQNGENLVLDSTVYINNGNVGIGTTVPQYKLDVRGAVAVGTAGATNQIHFLATPTASTDAATMGYVNDSMTAGDADWAGVGGDPTLAGEIYHTGNVGIGTTSSPGALLHVSSASKGTVAKLQTTRNVIGDTVDLEFLVATAQVGAKLGLVYEGSWDTGMAFYTRTAEGEGIQERVRIQHDGNVAVGTTSAGYKLDILSPDAIDSYLRVQRYDGDVQAGIMLSTGASTPLWTMYVDGGSREDLLFEHDGEVPFIISEDGYVGIGTDSPDTLLTIANDEWISAKDSAGTGHVNMFKVNTSNEIEVGGTLNIGTIGLAEDSGVVTLVNMPVSSTPSVGTEESYSFAIDSESILKVYSEADGTGGIQNKRVGIGTTSPSATLDVWGDLYADQGNITTDNLGNITAKSFYDKDNVLYYLDPSETGTSLNLAGVIQANGSGDNYFAGNVGIGVTNPVTRTEITNTGGGIQRTLALTNEQNNSDVGSTLEFRNSIFNGVTWLGASIQGVRNGSSAGHSIVFNTKRSGQDGEIVSEAMRISSGNVGIGTTSPSYTLDVAGNIGIDEYIYHNDDTDTYQRSLNDRWIMVAGGENMIDATENATQDYFYIGDGGDIDTWIKSANTGLFVEGNSGNVGIGTTVPGHKLDVRGAVAVGAAGATNQIHYVATPTTTTDAATKGYVDDASVDHASTADYATTAGSADHATYANSALRALYLGDSFNVTADSQGNLQVDGTGDSYLMGNVGIGTTVPQHKLDVRGAVAVGTAGATNQIHFLATPILGTDAANRAYIDDNFLPLAGGEPGGTGDAFIQGGNSFGALATLGTNDNYDLTFETNGSRKMTILTGGNVGIGTTVPVGLLHLKKSGSVWLYIDSESSTGQSGIVMNTHGQSILSNLGITFSGSSFGQTLAGKTTLTASSTTGLIIGTKGNAVPLNLGTNGISRIFIEGAGYVGIGTTVPQSALDVDGLIKMRDSTITQDEDVINLGYLEAAIDAAILSGDPDWSYDADPATKVYNLTADIGIGTNVPGAKLDVHENTANPIDNLRVSGDINYLSLGAREITAFRTKSSGVGLELGVDSVTGDGWTGSGGGVSFLTNDAGLLTTKMFIQNNGNVAIGTTSAGYKLDILAPDATDSYMRVQRYDAEVQAGIMLATGASTPLWTMYVDSGPREDLFFEYDGEVPFTISEDGRVGIGTTVPDTILTIANDSWISAKDSAGTGHVNMFKVNTSNEIEVGGTLNIGTIGLAEDSGVVTLVNMPVSSTPTAGTEESYSFAIDSEAILKVYSEADGTGGIQNKRVGIGTTSPSATLDVWGDLYADQGNITTDNLGNITAKSFYDKDSVLYYLDPATTGTSLNLAGIIQANGSGDNYFAGDVGIKTTTPDYALDVSGDVRLESTNRLRFSGTGSGDWGSSLRHESGLLTINTAGLVINDDGYTGTKDFFTILNSGNVGIGTTVPDTLLHLSKADGTSIIRLERDDWNIVTDEIYGALQFEGQDSSAASAAGVRGGIKGISEGTTGQMALTFETSGSYDATPIERIRIAGEGNVGIGTTVPQYKLDVRGAVAVGTAGATNQIHYVAVPTASTDAATMGYVDDQVGGAGGVGTGIANQTLRHDGDGWVASSTIYNNGTNVGIGTANPYTPLHIYESGAEATHTGTGEGVMRLVSNPNAGEFVALGFTEYHYPDRDLARISMKFGPGLSSELHFGTSNTYSGISNTAMVIDKDGNIGIGTATSQGRLHVQTASDVEIFRTEDETGSEAMVIDKDGNVIISL